MFAPEADFEEDRLDRRGALGRLEHVLDVERHAYRRTDRAPGIETALRILKHELRMPAQSLELLLRQIEQILAPSTTRPEAGVCSARIVRPSVLLPQPDSPTRPSVSPGSISRSTPSTAWT